LNNFTSGRAVDAINPTVNWFICWHGFQQISFSNDITTTLTKANF